MSREEKISALEGLLARVQRNANKPRVSAPVQGNGAGVAASGFEDLAEETTAVQDLVPPAAAMPSVTRLEPPAPPPVAAAAEEEVLEAEDVELYEGDIVELDDEVETAVVNPAPPLTAQPSSLNFEAEEEPPASSRRPKAAESMDEALAGAADQLDEGREVPIVTPPPESGRQVATPAGLAQPPLPDDLLDTGESADLNSGTHEVARPIPSTEQLGQTIDLEPPTHAPLELAEEPVPVSSRPSDLKVTLPKVPAPMPAPPPPAPAPVEPLVAKPLEPVAAKPLEPVLVARPAVASSQAAEFKPRPEFKPSTFVELLDASLELGAN